jgi:hypothetical protein
MATDPMLPRRLSTMSEERDAYNEAIAEDVDPDEDDTKKAAKTKAERHKKTVEEALERFKLAAEAETKQRERELEDLRFDRALPEDQWPREQLEIRGYYGNIQGQITPQRPCLVIPKLDQPVQQILNEARNARLAIKIKPKGDGATKEGAELRQGLIRAIEVDSNAQQARQWALDRAVKCGRGVYRILKTYANDGDFDLDLVISRILNQHAVYLDPYAKEPDWSDGEWAFIIEDIPKDEYKRRFKKSRLNDCDVGELSSLGDAAPGWVGDTTYRVAEYFYIEHEERWLIVDPVTGQKRLTEADEDPPEGAPARRVDKKTVKWCVINACEVLDEEDWDGRWIPLIPVIGKEYNVNGERCFKGLISNSKDGQRSYNYMRSAQVEAVGLAPKAPWIGAEGQFEGHQDAWGQANTRNFPYLEYKPTTHNGEVMPPPQRNTAEPAIQAISLAVSMADQDIKATTGRFDPSLGNFSSERSGKAIQRMQQQGEQSSSNYLDNLATISMRHEARVLLDLLPKIYDREGRLVRLLGESEKDERQVILNQPFVPGKDGIPVPVPQQPGAPMPGGPPQPQQPPPGPGQMPPQMGQPPPMGQMPQPNRLPKKAPKPKLMILNETGDYTVAVSVGRSFQTQREEDLALLQTMLEVGGEALAPAIMPYVAESMDGPMGGKVAAVLRKLNPQVAAAEQDDDAEIPPAAQAQIQQMQQQMQQMGQALQQATQEIKTRAQQQQMQSQADLQMKKMELESKFRSETMKLQAEMAKQRAQLEGELAKAEYDAATKKLLQDSQQQHDLQMAALEAALSEQAARRDEARAERAAGRDADLSDRQAVRDAHLTVVTRPPEKTRA